MFVLENKNVIVLFINKKIFQRLIYKYFNSQIEKVIKPYLCGSDTSIVSEIISRIIDRKELKKLYNNIRKFLNTTNSNLEINHILEYYINEKTYLDTYLNLGDFQEFISSLTVYELFTLLRINDYFRHTNQIDVQDKNFKKIYQRNNLIYMKWRKY